MKMSKIAAIVAAAALLVIGAAFTSMAATYDWQLENGEWVCYDKDGYQYYDTWAQSASGDWYYLGDEGVMATNQKVQWKSATVKYVFVGADGSIQKDVWQKIYDDADEETYGWYRFDANGYMIHGKKATVDGKIYFFDDNGKMLSGWVYASGSNYYSADNYMNGTYYCGGADEGAALTGWQKLNIAAEEEDEELKWFYFGSKGAKNTTSPKKINGVYYSFNEYGVMNSEWMLATDTAAYATQNQYFSDPESGARVTKGWFQAYAPGVEDPEEEEASLNWYYAIGSGKLAVSQIKKINGKYYCFDETGKMKSGLVWVYASESFALKSGTKAADGKTDLTCDTFVDSVKDGRGDGWNLYYFSGDGEKDGSMKFGTQKVTVDDEQFTLYFNNASGTTRGQALNTRNAKAIYFNGVKLAADAESRYGIVFFDGKEYGKTVESASKYVGKTAAEMTNYVVINSAGRTLTSLSAKDGDDYKIVVKEGKIQSIALAD